jgi:dipeptidyl-peptidase 4
MLGVPSISYRPIRKGNLTYTGPQGAFVPKTFAAFRHQQQAIAELGFITVFVDGRGTALRSRAFRAFAYHKLGFGSASDDHITVFKQMAAKYPYMDLTKVGVWGHSAGGYDSTHAILTHPEFYKVAVSSAGCHDNRMDKATWNEQWMGWPVDKHYEEQSNYTLAERLQGKDNVDQPGRQLEVMPGVWRGPRAPRRFITRDRPSM